MLAGLTLAFNAAATIAWISPAVAADQTVAVAPGNLVGPISAEVGDVISVVAAQDLTVTALDVGGVGVIPVVVVGISPTPGSVLCDASGLITRPISFSYGSVVSPTDVPEADILAALSAIPIDSAVLSVVVAAPPPPPPPPPPPVVPPPVVSPPATDAPRTTQPPRTPAELDEELGGIPLVLIPAANAPATSSSSPPRRETGPNQESDSSAGVLGIDTMSSVVETTAAAGFDDLPMVLGLPSLLALLSISVVGAGMARLQLLPVRRRR